MMRSTLTSLLIRLLPLALLAGLLIGCAGQPASPSPGGHQTITFEECQLSAPGLSVRLPAECGKLAVYEDRAANSGRQIELNIARIPAVSRNPAPDPLFFLTGGPGQAATESYLQLSTAFDSINQKREIILVDQRGTGQSNPLDCPEVEQESDLPSESGQEVARLKECLGKLDANPALYTTWIAMQDLDQVRAALGYEEINIYGLSYGTRAALTYLKQFPEHVRTVILDGVVPQDEPLGLDVARDAQRALDLILTRCEKEAACSKAFLGVRGEFSALLDRLKSSPVDVSLNHPSTGEPVTISFTAEKMASAIRLLTYAQETVALLPLIIHTAASDNDFRLLAAQYLIVSSQIGGSISEGMNFSVLCAEDFPFITPEAAEQANANTYLDNLQTQGLADICAFWPRGDTPADFKQPVQSDVPVLILSGEVDPVTPPENGMQIAKTLPNSLNLVAAGQGHNVIYRGCLPRVAKDFVESGSVQGLDTACVQNIRPMPYFVNFSGPMP